MSNESGWANYVRTNSNGDNNAAIAAKVGVAGATAGRWVNSETVAQPQQVIAFARAYSLSPIPGLIAAGHITIDDIPDDIVVEQSDGLESIATRTLVDELARRIDAMSDYAEWVDAIVNGARSRAQLGAATLRYLDPRRPPSSVRGEDFAEALAPHVTAVSTHSDNTVYSVGDDLATARRRRNVGTPAEDEEAPIKQPPAKQRTAAKKGTRKADRAPHAE